MWPLYGGAPRLAWTMMGGGGGGQRIVNKQCLPPNLLVCLNLAQRRAGEGGGARVPPYPYLFPTPPNWSIQEISTPTVLAGRFW